MGTPTTKPGRRGKPAAPEFAFAGASQSLSPRMAWLKNHDVRTHHFTEDPEKWDSYNHLGFGTWVAYVGKTVPPHEDSERVWSCADSEDDALVNLAKRMGWLLWQEELAAPRPLNAKPTIKP